MTKQIDLGLGVLDHQLLDSEGRRCGNVDDLELEGVRDGKPVVVAILTGPPAWAGRGVIGRLAARLARGRWCGSRGRRWHDQVLRALRKPAEELGLGRGDDRVAPDRREDPGIVAVRVSDLIGVSVRTESETASAGCTTSAPSRRARR